MKQKIRQSLTGHPAIYTWFSIFFGLILLTAILEYFNVDLTISKLFHSPTLGWYLKEAQPWKWIYQYGTMGGLILTIGTLFLWALSYYVPSLVSWRRIFLLIFFTAIIGGGLVVNIILKDYWGRPRPYNVLSALFDYRPIFSLPEPGHGQSFPCGHCTMGYLLITLFYLREKSKTLAYLGGTFGIVYGMLVSAARIVQGGHFFSDTLWAFGVILLTSLALKPLFWREARSPLGEWVSGSWKNKLLFFLGVGIVLGGITTAFMTRRPYTHRTTYNFDLPKNMEVLTIQTSIPEKHFSFQAHNHHYLTVLLDAQGFGWTQASYHLLIKLTETNQRGETLDIKGVKKHYFSELNQKMTLYFPENRKIKFIFKEISTEEEKE